MPWGDPPPRALRLTSPGREPLPGAMRLTSLLLACVALAQLTLSQPQGCPQVATISVQQGATNTACCGGAVACGSLDSALAVAAAGAVITVGPGTYTRLTAQPLLVTQRALTITAPAPGAILDCGNGACLSAACAGAGAGAGVGVGCSLTISGLTVQKGSGAASGGCLSTVDYAVTLQGVSFQNCQAVSYGGAVSIQGGPSASLTDVSFSACSTLGTGAATPAAPVPVSRGGGLFVSGSAAASLLRVSVANCRAQAADNGAGDGGGVAIIGGGKHSVDSSTFSGCLAYFNGGGLYTANADSVTVSNCTFTTSKAVNGGGYADTNSTVTVSGTTFSNLVANQTVLIADGSFPGQGGGLCSLASVSLSLDSCSFLRCNASVMGGGAFIQSTPAPAVLRDIVFDNCVSTGGGAMLLQGCPEGSSGTNITFTHNLAWANLPGSVMGFGVGYGSAVMAVSCPMSFDKSYFGSNNCSAWDPASQGYTSAQGTLYYQSLFAVAVSVTDCTFEDNVVDGPAGICADTGEVTVRNSKFLRNVCTLGAGAAVLSSTNTTLDSCVFDSNWGTAEIQTSQKGGGAVTQYQMGTLTVNNCTFTRNYMIAENGGALYVGEGSSLVIQGSTFDSNWAVSSRAGAVEFLGDTMSVSDTLFLNNSALNNGGAMSLVGTGGTYSITNSTFTQNSAGNGGGAIFSSSKTVANIVQSRFQGNKAGLGAAMQLQELSNFTVSSSYCGFNLATLGGGCLSLSESSSITIVSSDLVSNNAVTEGGAIRVSGLSVGTFKSSNVSDNTAQWGAGFWTEMVSVLDITNCTVANNVASFQAGALYCGQNSTAYLHNSTIANNTAPQGGGAVVTAIANLVATATGFFGNSPSGVVASGFSEFTCTGCSFERNLNLLGMGGGISVSDEPTVTVQSSAFASNIGVEGGAVYSTGQAVLRMTDCAFTSNTAQVGGALALSGATNATVTRSAFSANNATSAGGGVAILGQSHGVLDSANFTANYAVASGAGVYVLRSNAYGSNISATPFVASNLRFTSNKALQEGGGAYFDATEDPQERTACQYCSQATATDTLATVPADLDLTWPGLQQTLKGSQGPFTVLAAVEAPIQGLTVTIKDLYGNDVTSDNASLALVSPDYRISGLLRGTAVKGMVQIPPINVQVAPSEAQTFNLTVTVSSPSGAFLDYSRTFQIGFCPGGEFFQASSYSCQPCPVGSWCAAGQPVQPCPYGTFSFYAGASSTANCVSCDSSDSLTCQDGTLQMGYQNWLDVSTLNDTPKTYPCLVTNGCPGLGSPSPYTDVLYQYTGPDTVQCEPGYSADTPTCGLCESSPNQYYYFIGYCQECTQFFKDIFFVLLALVVVAWVVMVVMANNFLCVDNFLNEVQLIVMIGSTNLNFPPNAMWMMRILQIYNLTVFDPDLIGPQCWFNYSFVERFYISLAIPLVGLAVYGVSYVFHTYFKSLFVHVHSFSTETYGKRVLERSLSRRRESSDYNNSILHACTNWLDICYILVLTRVLAVFGRQEIGTTYVLALAPQVVWLSQQHIWMMVVGSIYGTLYLVGLPCFYAWALTRAKRDSSFDATEFRQKFGWLTERYKRRFWWWHMTNIALRIIHAAILVFLIEETNIQVVIFLPIQALRIAMQWKTSALASQSLDYLQASLTLGEFMFTFSLVVYNYMNQTVFSQILYGVSTALIVLPFCFVFAYEAINKHLEMRNNQMLNKIWKLEKRHNKDKFQGMDPYDLVDLHEVSEWFRPHIISAMLLSKSHSRERQLLLRVRDRVQACKLRGLANVDWVNHLKKPQLYAVLSQALLGASAGHITVARIPRNGFFCKEHGIWHSEEHCSLQHQPLTGHPQQPQGGKPLGRPTTPLEGGAPPSSTASPLPPRTPPVARGGQEAKVASVAWPQTLERHISWNASYSRSMDFDSLSLSREQSTGAGTPTGALQPSASARHPDGTLLPRQAQGQGQGSPAPSSFSGTPLSGTPGAPGAGAGAGAGADADPFQLHRAPSIRVQNLRVSWGANGQQQPPGGAPEGAGAPAGGALVPPAAAGAGGAAGAARPAGAGAVVAAEEEFVEAKMNMTELTLTFQRHLSVLVHSEKKKKEDSLRLVIRSEYIPIILSWLTSPSSNKDDQRLLRRLVVGLRAVAMEEAGGLGWWNGIKCFLRNWSGRPNYSEDVETSGKAEEEASGDVNSAGLMLKDVGATYSESSQM